MNKNYIIWADSRGLPTKTHASYTLALSEATRLAKKHPEVAFGIYGLVGSAIGHTGVDFTPVPEEAPEPKPEGVDLTLLGIGSTVRLRDGRKKALVERYVAPSLDAEIFVFSDLGLFDGGTVGHVYTYANGRFYSTGESAYDVVEILNVKEDKAPTSARVDLSEIEPGQQLRRRDGGLVYFAGFKFGGFLECRSWCSTMSEPRYSWVDLNGSADPTGRSVAADIVEIVREEEHDVGLGRQCGCIE
jgi:hypothetical protein